MSARRRRKQERVNSSGAETPARTPILRRFSEALIMALALIAGAIFLALLLSPASFYSAVTHKESMPFYSQTEARAKLLQVTRDDLFRSIYQSMGEWTQLARGGLDSMLRTIADSEKKDIDASAAMDALRLDPHNDLTRLASAMILVFADASPPPAGGISPELAQSLFGKLNTILDLTTPTGMATTYHMDVLTRMQAAYREHFNRPDVALVVAEVDAPYLGIPARHSPAYQQGFPAMQRRLGAIAAALETSGHAREAAQCRSWFRRPMLEVFDRDTDTPMRLLCLDLLIRDVAEGSPARQRLVQMRDEFVQLASEAPADRTDVFGQRTAVAPAEYRAVQTWLIASIVLALVAAGAAGAFFIALVLRRFVSEQSEIVQRPLSTQVMTWLIAFSLILFGVYACTASAASNGPFSGHWTLHMIILSVWFGIGVPCAFSGFHDPTNGSSWWIRLGFILPLAPLILYCFPPIWIVEFSRYMDRWLHPMWAGVALAAIGALVGLVLNRRRLRAVRKTAALICASTACLALAAYGVKTIADSRWQEAAVTGRLDEFSARLGFDWRTRLLAPLKQELLGEGP